MDSNRLANLLDNIYIPPSGKLQNVEVPNYHPSLIVQDLQTDITKPKPCGCTDRYCVKNAPAWIPSDKR